MSSHNIEILKLNEKAKYVHFASLEKDNLIAQEIIV